MCGPLSVHFCALCVQFSSYTSYCSVCHVSYEPINGMELNEWQYIRHKFFKLTKERFWPLYYHHHHHHVRLIISLTDCKLK